MGKVPKCSNKGYEGYRNSLSLEIDSKQIEETNSDELSSDWESDPSYSKLNEKTSGWKKVRNVVRWSPFIQTCKKKNYPWIQLAGHAGNFKAGNQGTIYKKSCRQEEICFQNLMNDTLFKFVPKFKGVVTAENGENFLELEDLLASFTSPTIMDIKLGVRTYLEEELIKARENPKLRKDMYEKMIQIDPNEPTEEERKLRAVSKPRYMVWRETISSTSSLGFRIEGIKYSDGTTRKDFKITKTREQILSEFEKFTNNQLNIKIKYLERLKKLKELLKKSHFFHTHEVLVILKECFILFLESNLNTNQLIGSSLLFVHDSTQANIWMIDFAKTFPLPDGIKINHDNEWQVGNHEDGYMFGLNNIISIFEDTVNDEGSSRESIE